MTDDKGLSVDNIHRVYVEIPASLRAAAKTRLTGCAQRRDLSL